MKNQRLMILAMLVIYIFSPTIFTWVIDPNGSWYRPFMIWSLLIATAFVFQFRRGRE